ncbi:MAG: hypothetical protein ACK5PI_06585 [Acetobacteraceae bacterium]
MTDLSPLLGRTALGLVVPPSNPTVEPEIAWLLGGGARIHAARLPVMPGTDLAERNRRYPGTYAGTTAAFGSLRLDALAIGLTGASYPLGLDGDAALCEELTATTRRPVVTAARALVEALQAIGAKRIGLLSPYPAWLTGQAEAFWAAAGVTLAEVVKIDGEFRAYEMTAEEVSAALDRFTEPRLDAIMLSGTGMITLPAIVPRATAGRPRVSCNTATAFWLARAAGMRPTQELAAAAPALAALL